MRVAFDRFTFDSERRELLDGDEPVHVGPKAFHLLETLIASSPRAISKRELYEQIWPDTFVDDSNLAGLVNELRAALGDQARSSRFIRTVHGFGYAFCEDLNTGERVTSPCVITFNGREFSLRAGVNVLGRDAATDIQIDDPTVSRRHASITIGDDVTLRDLDSKNGTFLDGVKLAGSIPLADSATITLGDASVLFRRARGKATTVTRISTRRRAPQGGC